MKITIILIKLLFIGALFIISNYNLHLNNEAERNLFFDFYYSWFENLFMQGMEVTKYVIGFEWLPQINQTYIESNPNI